MPEILPDHVPSPRTLLAWDGTAYRPLTIDAAGHLQLDVLTAAGLEDALQSVATDRLIVRGEDQLFSFHRVLASERVGVISGANGFLDSNPCTAGHIWCVTDIAAIDTTTPTTLHEYNLTHDLISYIFGESRAAFPANQWAYWSGFKWLDEADVIRVYFAGGLAGDTCVVTLTGYIMTFEV